MRSASPEFSAHLSDFASAIRLRCPQIRRIPAHSAGIPLLSHLSVHSAPSTLFSLFASSPLAARDFSSAVMMEARVIVESGEVVVFSKRDMAPIIDVFHILDKH
jgi:hypothetical protein